MSVQINDLSKHYGHQKAVDGLSFEAQKGEILGFLGPNGAGKSTTMKMITGYLAPTSGSVMVCGMDTQEQTLEIQKKLGYLPEHNPLYKEMYVKEYLHFIARIHKIPNRKTRVAEMISWTGLEREQHKPIAALSKGYRQRIGLAQAMIHDPEVLILDEPTSGLDPNQLAEIRQLIKELGKEKTVILSTHIMQEVQALCDRVVIINQGEMVANDTIQVLQAQLNGGTLVRIQFDKPVQKTALTAIPGVQSIQAFPKHIYEVTGNTDLDLRPSLFQFAVDQKLILLEMTQKTRSVEAIFQELTQQQKNSN